jgi:hypothetical protein
MAGVGTMEAVINGEFFSCLDFPEAVQEDFPTDSAHRQIRIATMIDELGAASSHCSIEAPTPIQTYRVNPPCFSRPEDPYGTTHSFRLVYSLTCILDHPLARRDRFLSEYAKSFDARPANAEPKPGELRIETRNVTLRGHINGAE